MKFKFLAHTADLKFKAYGKTVEEVFINSAKALMSQIFSGRVKEKEKIKINLSGKDYESLLYNFLEEIIFLIDSKGFLVSEVKDLKIDKKSFKLSGVFEGDSGENYEVHTHIKAVTYNEMFVKRERGKWVSQVVLDV
ncbi:archease [Candidatus Pacearchaeota archaeon]|nr:hypothetical protein [uncultured archaeon]MBS3084464.1 archease [Candidatus Pacearchaeota archaeon]